MAWLGQLGALGWVDGETTMQSSVERAGQFHVTPGGQIGGRQSSHRSLRAWTVNIEAASPADVHGYYLANAGAFGLTCLWVSDVAASVNVLTPEQVAGFRGARVPMWSSGVVDLTPVRLPGGGLTGGTIVRGAGTAARVLLDARGQQARVPCLPGLPFRFSALLNAAGSAVRVGFRNVAGVAVAGGGARSFNGTPGVLARTTFSATPPAAAAYAICQVDGDGRIADPVVTLGQPADPVSAGDGRGVEAVRVPVVRQDPWMSLPGDGGHVADYEVVIEEVNSL